jgi:ADP-ribosylation factor-like protein 1
VVDSADQDRLATAKAELHAMLEEEDLKDAILLVMANKQDQQGALQAAGIAEAMALPSLKKRQWNIQETCATQGKGLFDGFDWLVQCSKGGSGTDVQAPPVAAAAAATGQ